MNTLIPIIVCTLVAITFFFIGKSFAKVIKPTSKGHDEFSIINNERIAAKELGINIETVNERKKVLLKREKHGRTGVFLKRSIEIDETTEDVLKKLANKKSIVRKKLYKR